jgi:hypothetical protein
LAYTMKVLDATVGRTQTGRRSIIDDASSIGLA